MRTKRIVMSLIATLFTCMLLNIGLFMLPAVASGGSYDWPMHGYDSACTSYSPSTAPNTNTTAWVADLPGGTVWAYPVVAEGKVFIGAGGYLNAFDENTGGLVWRFRALDQPGYPCCSAVADGRVFFGTGEPGPGGAMYALNATTGDQIWNFTTEEYLRAPVVVDDRLYFGVDTNAPNVGKIYCLNAATGEHIWNYTTQDKGVTIAVAYGKVYAGCGHWITSATGYVYCLDMYDGSYVWGFQTNRDITGTVSVANGKVYFVASYEGWDCKVFALNATNGNEVWSTIRYSNGDAGRTAVAYGKVFIALGYGARGVYALNETNGDEIWRFLATGGGGPVVADGKVFFADIYPNHMFYAVNEATGVVIWSYKLGGSVHSWTSAIANGRVFVADYWDPKLYAFGEPVQPPLSVSASPLSASILVGQSVTFTSTVSGGYTPYSYQWYLNAAPVSGATSNTWAFTPATSGIYYVYLKVTDAKANTSQSDTARIAVASVPVGGYSIPIQAPTTEKPSSLYLAIMAILITAFTTVKRKTHKRRK